VAFLAKGQKRNSIPSHFLIGGSTPMATGALRNLSSGIGQTDNAADVPVAISFPIRLDNPLFEKKKRAAFQNLPGCCAVRLGQSVLKNLH